MTTVRAFVLAAAFGSLSGPSAGWASAGLGDGRGVAELRARCLQVLRTELAGPPGWERIHAAEALVVHGDDTGVREAFAVEVPIAAQPHRIGLWRIMARTASTLEERQAAVDRVRAVFRDEASPDRLLALETLAKLSVGDAAELPAIDSWLGTAEEPIAAFLWWLRAELGPEVERDEAEEALSRSLASKNELSRRRSAYALCRLQQLRSGTLDRLRMAAAFEPPSSPARAKILAATLVHAPRGSAEAAVLISELRVYLESGTTAEKYEVSVILGRCGEPADVLGLARLLEASEPDERIGGASGLLYLLQQPGVAAN